MLHVLHLVGCEDQLHALRSSQLLCSALGPEFPITRRSIGRGGDYRNAVHAAFSFRFGGGLEFDLIHAWDVTALIASLGAALPTVFSPQVPFTRQLANWTRIAAPRQTVHMITATHAQRASWLKLGAPAERCHAVPPAIDPAGAPWTGNARLRQQLGYTPDDYVVLVPGETTRASEHRRALWAISILHVLDERWRVLLWGKGPDLEITRSLAKRLGQRRLLATAEQTLGRSLEFDELIGAADAAMVPARREPSTVPILMCMAGGLPIVAAASPCAHEILREGQTGLMVSDGAPRSLARAMLRLREDPELGRRLADAAARDVTTRFSAAQFVHHMRQIYWAAGMTGGNPLQSAQWLATKPAC